MKNKSIFIKIILSISIITIITIVIVTLIYKNKNQQNLGLSFRWLKKKKNNNKILCFTGGGFTAICAHTGMIKGIRYTKGDLRDILNDFSVVGGNSGGSWFVSLLTYSKNYFDMLNNDQETDTKNSENTNSITYKKYITQACKNMENSQNNVKYKSVIEKLPSFLNDIKKILYMSSQNWQEIVQEIVFDPVGDINKTQISQNPNDFSHSIVWATTISRFSLLDKNHAYNISHPSCGTGSNTKKIFLSSNELQSDLQTCGIAFPATFNWNLSKNKSDINFYNGDNPIPEIKCGLYNNNSDLSDINTISVNKKLSKPLTGELLVSNIASSSGAAAGILSNLKAVDEILEKYHSRWFLSPIASQFSGSYKNKAIPLQIEDNINFTPNGGIDNNNKNCPGNFIRLFDGGYCDNTSIASSLATWQTKHGAVTNETCHIINFNDISNDSDFDVNTGYKKTNKDIINLFGTPTERVVKRFTGVYTEKPVIFPQEDFSNGKCLWWGKYNSSQNTTCIQDDNCYAELSVNYYQTKTLENKSFGIKQGTKVNLFILQTNTKKAPIFILPNTISDSTLINNYVKTADAVTKLVQNISPEIMNAIMDPSAPIPTKECGKSAINITD
jgi:hypothetical protein